MNPELLADIYMQINQKFQEPNLGMVHENLNSEIELPKGRIPYYAYLIKDLNGNH